MVSFQKLPELSDKSRPITNKRSEISQGDSETTSLLAMPTKKLRTQDEEEEFLDERRWKRSHNTPSLLIDVDLRLHTPLPPVLASWPTDHNAPLKQTQNLCNIRSKQKTTLSSSNKDQISLDLGLNLLCSTKSPSNNNNNCQDMRERDLLKPNINYYRKKFDTAMKSNVAGEVDREEEEMVAKACMRCHMLVMMCKSSPCCPNCKFMHPLDHHNPSQSNTLLLKPPPTTTNNNNKTSSSCVS